MMDNTAQVMNKIKTALMALLIIGFYGGFAFGSGVSVVKADLESDCVDAGGTWGVIGVDAGIDQLGCIGVSTGSLVSPSSGGASGTPVIVTGPTSTCTSGGNCKVFDMINAILNVLAIGATIVITIVLAVGGIQYTASNGNPQRVQAAKNRIYNAIWAYGSFVGMWAFLNYLIPGGVLL